MYFSIFEILKLLLMRTFFNLILPSFLLLLSCEKSNIHFDEIVSNDAFELRSEIQQMGYIETIADSIHKRNCFFDKWNKTILTPISGLIEFHDAEGNWVASIDFGSGECDQWATKSWNTNIFTEKDSVETKFSVFSFHKKN